MRHFGFDPGRLQSKAAAPFLGVVRSVCGLPPKGKSTDCLMSSLPSELTFNDMRDVCRRAKKSDRAQPAHMHSVASKSVATRTKCVSTVELESNDWAASLPHGGGAVRASVHSAMRSSDIQLGINVNGLTRCRSNKVLTKPHVLVARFEAFQLLREVWCRADGSDEEKSTAVHDAHESMWLCKLLQPHMLIRLLDSDDESVRYLMISCGPNAIKAVTLKFSDDENCWILASNSFRTCTSFLLHKLDNIEVDMEWKINMPI